MYVLTRLSLLKNIVNHKSICRTQHPDADSSMNRCGTYVEKMDEREVETPVKRYEWFKYTAFDCSIACIYLCIGSRKVFCSTSSYRCIANCMCGKVSVQLNTMVYNVALNIALYCTVHTSHRFQLMSLRVTSIQNSVR